MTEADVLAELSYRADHNWTLLFWWVNICFAVMVASFIGANRLTRSLVIILIGAILFTASYVIVGVFQNSGYQQAAWQELRNISEATELSAVGQYYLAGNNFDQYSQPSFFIFSLIFTIGFVIFCNRVVKVSGRSS